MKPSDEGEVFQHPVYTHPNGDKCIWLPSKTDGYEGEWFVPHDVGGEGVTCPYWHPTDDAWLVALKAVLGELHTEMRWQTEMEGRTNGAGISHKHWYANARMEVVYKVISQWRADRKANRPL